MSASADGVYYFNSWFEESHSIASAGNSEINVGAGRWSATAFGESSYEFISNNDKLSLSANGMVGCHPDADFGYASIFLHDLTTDTREFSYKFEPYMVYDDDLSNPERYSFELNEDITIQKSHRYMFNVAVYAGRSDSSTNGNIAYNISTQPAPVPEPATMLFFGTGLVALAGFSIRRKKKA